MKQEKSCGAVLFTKESDNLKVILINLVNGGHWSFPKGHVEGNESETETALREIREETGLDKVNLINDFRMSTKYSPKEGVVKEVIYFIATTSNPDTIKIQKEEVNRYIICDINKALDTITYENDKKILSSAIDYINGHKDIIDW